MSQISNSHLKFDIRFVKKPNGHRWIYLELLKYGPPYPVLVPSFLDLHRIVQAIATCEDERYPPPLKGRQKLADFLYAAAMGTSYEDLKGRYQIPDRVGSRVVNANGSAVVDAPFFSKPDPAVTPAQPVADLTADDIPWGGK